MKKTILLTLVLISVLALAIQLSSAQLKQFFGIDLTSGINITSIPEGATVFVDDIEVGKTPYEMKDLKAQEYVVKLVKDESLWQGKVKLIGGSLTLVNRELSKDVSSSAGEVLALEKGKGITLISNPSGSDIEIDGKDYGKTPLSVDISDGDHIIVVGHANYIKRSIKANLPKGYNLTISVDLALSEADLTSVNIPVINTTPMVVVKSTPTGFLRVREKPTTSGKEITRVKPGDELVLLEELGVWYRIKLPDGKEGYVSANYVEKKK